MKELFGMWTKFDTAIKGVKNGRAKRALAEVVTDEDREVLAALVLDPNATQAWTVDTAQAYIEEFLKGSDYDAKGIAKALAGVLVEIRNLGFLWKQAEKEELPKVEDESGKPVVKVTVPEESKAEEKPNPQISPTVPVVKVEVPIEERLFMPTLISAREKCANWRMRAQNSAKIIEVEKKGMGAKIVNGLNRAAATTCYGAMVATTWTTDKVHRVASPVIGAAKWAAEKVWNGICKVASAIGSFFGGIWDKMFGPNPTDQRHLANEAADQIGG